MQAARDAVDDFVAELQAGIDAGDAETYNAHFSDDVAWGSPYGATVVGYDAVHVSAPAPDVAIAQVRRVAIDADGEPVPIDDAAIVSEMALYVLVRRDGHWWLAGGQNTPIRPKP